MSLSCRIEGVHRPNPEAPMIVTDWMARGTRAGAHLNDDLHVMLSRCRKNCLPRRLWPNVVRRLTVPADVEALLLTELERVQ
jgi:hypothetical protein